MKAAPAWSQRCAGRRPAISRRIVSRAGIQPGAAATIVVVGSAPDNHLTTRPHCRVIDSGTWGAGGVESRPRVGREIVAAASVIAVADILSAPDNHLGSRPHRGVIASRCGRIESAG